MPESNARTDQAGGSLHRTAESVRLERERLLADLFPGGVPRLWCPTLTHFRAPGELDEARIQRHLEHLAPFARGILVPGSTGEGWEMNDDDIRRLLEVVLGAARRVNIHVLIGVLRNTVADMRRGITDTVEWLKSRTGEATADQALARSRVVGFTVCPPKGAELSQEVIRESLAEVLSWGLPTALYQLPQITENEMTPQTVRHLADRHANFFLFKDTSGRDTVALAGEDLGGVFLVRGAEGDYARVTRAGGGPYDGLLLSTANVFAAEEDQILRWLDEGRVDEAESLAASVDRVVQQTFDLVADFATGNPFTNANKTLDHIMAHGAAAAGVEPPFLYSGVRLPAVFVRRSVGFLQAADLLPDDGYLA